MPIFADKTVNSPFAVETVTGQYVDVVAPDPNTIKIEDIAWSLSRQARFAGHTISNEIWNVAQHSLFVEELVDLALHDPADEADLRTSLRQWLFDANLLNEFEKISFTSALTTDVNMDALLHDATEAYLIDLPTPAKRATGLREPYKLLENGLNLAVRQGLKMGEQTAMSQAIVTWADLVALQIEASILMPSRGRGWTGHMPTVGMQHMSLMPEIEHWRTSYTRLLDRHKLLRAGGE